MLVQTALASVYTSSYVPPPPTIDSYVVYPTSIVVSLTSLLHPSYVHSYEIQSIKTPLTLPTSTTQTPQHVGKQSVALDVRSSAVNRWVVSDRALDSKYS